LSRYHATWSRAGKQITDDISSRTGAPWWPLEIPKMYWDLSVCFRVRVDGWRTKVTILACFTNLVCFTILACFTTLATATGINWLEIDDTCQKYWQIAAWDPGRYPTVPCNKEGASLRIILIFDFWPITSPLCILIQHQRTAKKYVSTKTPYPLYWWFLTRTPLLLCHSEVSRAKSKKQAKLEQMSGGWAKQESLTRNFQFATASTEWLEKGVQSAQIPALADKVKFSCRALQTSSKVVCVHVCVCVCVYACSCLFFCVRVGLDGASSADL